MKRVWLVLLICALAGSTVFAGGKGESGAAASGSQEIVLEAWNVEDPAQSPDAVAVEEVYKAYETAHPGVKIVHNINVYTPLREKVIIAGQAKTGPDLIHMLGEWVPEFSAMGVIQDMSAEVKSWADYNQFPESTWKVATSEGKIWGIPSTASTRLLLYRGDLFDQAGITQAPKTFAEVRETAKKLTKDGMYGFAFCSASNSTRGSQHFSSLLYSVGKAELAVLRNGKWVPGFTVDQVEKVFQFYYDLTFVDKVVPPFSIGWDYPELDNAFAAGTMAMCMNGAWMSRRVSETEHGPSWKTSDFPYLQNPATYAEVKVEGIGSFSKAPKELLVDITKFLSNQDNSVYTHLYNNLPPRLDATASKLWKPDTYWRDNFLKAIPSGFTWPSIPIADILAATMDNLQEVLYQRMTPRQSAEDFHRKVQRYLDNDIN